MASKLGVGQDLREENYLYKSSNNLWPYCVQTIRTQSKIQRSESQLLVFFFHVKSTLTYEPQSKMPTDKTAKLHTWIGTHNPASKASGPQF